MKLQYHGKYFVRKATYRRIAVYLGFHVGQYGRYVGGYKLKGLVLSQDKKPPLVVGAILNSLALAPQLYFIFRLNPL